MAGTIIVAVRRAAAQNLLKNRGEGSPLEGGDEGGDEGSKLKTGDGKPSEASIQFDKDVVPIDTKKIPEGAPVKMMIEGSFVSAGKNKISLSVTAFQLQMGTEKGGGEERSSHENGGSSHKDKNKTIPGNTISYST